jgi:hypothetical protein
MNSVELVKAAKTADLVAFYNSQNPTKPVKKFVNRATAEARCIALLPAPVAEATRAAEEAAESSSKAAERYTTPGMLVDQAVSTAVAKLTAKKDPAPAPDGRPEMKASLRLRREIVEVDTDMIWPNAHVMWKENPEWMTSAQQDRLTKTLYTAAKLGELVEVDINGRRFKLAHAPEAA